MPNKHLFKLSAISVALLGFTSVGYAVECGVPMSAHHSLVAILSDCKLDVDATADELRYKKALLDVDNTTLFIHNSNLTLSGDYSADTLHISSSNVTVIDSALTRNGIFDGDYYASLIKMNNENTRSNTRLTLSNVSLSSTGEVSVIDVSSSKEKDVSTFVRLDNSKAISEDTIFGSFWTTEHNSNQYSNIAIEVKDSTLKAPGIIATSGLDEFYQETGIKGNERITLNIDNSELSGTIHTSQTDEGYSVLNVNATNSTLNMPTYLNQDEGSTYFNGVTNLNLQNSQITLDKNNGFQTFTVYDNLSGNGHFNLNTDLANEQSDKIVVKGKDSGTFTLGIQDSGNEPKTINGKVTLVETQTGQAQFSLKDREYVDAGAYRYRLSQDGTNWILSNRAGETNTQPEPVSEPEPPVEQPAVETPVAETVEQSVVEIPVAETVEQPAVETLVPVVVAPVIPAVVESITNDKPSEQPAMAVLSEKSNALVSLRQAQGLLISQNLQGIHQRLGELKTDKTSHIWGKNINGRTNAKAQNVAVDSRSSGFEMDYHNLQIGADRAVSENVRLGGFVGTSRADVDFNGEYGKGKLRSQAVGLYGTFVNENSWYWDNVAKYERLTAQSASLDKRKYNAFSLSSEIGKQVAFGNQWTLTPQAQLAYHSISSTADEDRLSLFSVRTGLRLAKGIELGNWTLQPYAEVNGIFENTHDAKVRVNQYQFDVPESKNRVQTALGLTAGNGSHRLGLEFSQTHGKQVRQPFNLLANYRYQW